MASSFPLVQVVFFPRLCRVVVFFWFETFPAKPWSLANAVPPPSPKSPPPGHPYQLGLSEMGQLFRSGLLGWFWVFSHGISLGSPHVTLLFVGFPKPRDRTKEAFSVKVGSSFPNEVSLPHFPTPPVSSVKLLTHLLGCARGRLDSCARPLEL